jgi:predicted RND superfamily exporter protein
VFTWHRRRRRAAPKPGELRHASQDKATLLERLIFNNRPVVIAICLLVSIFLFWQATQIRPSTSFEKMIPLQHPFIEQMMEHRNDLANLGNTVRISVEAVNGDIFDKDYMETLRQIHDEVFYIPASTAPASSRCGAPACAGPKSPKRASPAAR